MNVGQGQGDLASQFVATTSASGTAFSPATSQFGVLAPPGATFQFAGVGAGFGFTWQETRVGALRQAAQFNRATGLVTTIGFFGPTYNMSPIEASVTGLDSTLAAWTFVLLSRTFNNNPAQIGDSLVQTIKDIGYLASTNNITVTGANILTSSTGTSDGSTVFTDSTPHFSFNVIPGDWLNIPAGPAAGSYKIVSVDSNTQITLETSVLADTPITYHLSEGGVDGQFSYIINTDGGAVTVNYIDGYGWRRIL